MNVASLAQILHQKTFKKNYAKMVLANMDATKQGGAFRNEMIGSFNIPD